MFVCNNLFYYYHNFGLECLSDMADVVLFARFSTAGRKTKLSRNENEHEHINKCTFFFLVEDSFVNFNHGSVEETISQMDKIGSDSVQECV